MTHPLAATYRRFLLATIGCFDWRETRDNAGLACPHFYVSYELLDGPHLPLHIWRRLALRHADSYLHGVNYLLEWILATNSVKSVKPLKSPAG